MHVYSDTIRNYGKDTHERSVSSFLSRKSFVVGECPREGHTI
jgi:hypothetical protein